MFVLELMTSVGFGLTVDFQNGKGGEIYKAARDIAGLTDESFHYGDDNTHLMLIDAAMGKTIYTILGVVYKGLYTCTHTHTQTHTHTHTHAHTPFIYMQ